MKDNPTPEEVRASIIPKSDQLNADDLLTGPITVTIEKVRRGDKDQPIIVEIAGHRPYKPCKTMRRVLIATFSDDPKAWVGQQMTLFCDPDVLWAGVRVGGIRISALSGLNNARTFLLTQGRGKRTEVTIHPIRAADHGQQIDEVLAEIAKAETEEALKAVGFAIKQRPKAVQEAMRAAYGKRLKTLRDQSQKAPPAAAPKLDTNEAAQLQEWLTGIGPLDTLEACREFREQILPDCPATIRPEVEKALLAHEGKLQGEGS